AFFQKRANQPRRIDVEHDAIGVDLGSSENLAYQIARTWRIRSCSASLDRRSHRAESAAAASRSLFCIGASRSTSDSAFRNSMGSANKDRTRSVTSASRFDAGIR